MDWVVAVRSGEEKAECKSKALDLSHYLHLWSQALAERRTLRIQVVDTSDFLHRVAGLFLGDKMKSSVIWKRIWVEPLLLQTERSQIRWSKHLTQMPPGHLPGRCSRHVLPWGGPRVEPGQTTVLPTQLKKRVDPSIEIHLDFKQKIYLPKMFVELKLQSAFHLTSICVGG